MTNAPTDLMQVRSYVLAHTGLPGDAVGIVGDPVHAATGGYHEGRVDLARVGRATSDYSVRESSRDSGGLTDSASALDIGDFNRNGKSLRGWSLFLVGRCQAGDPRCRDIREVIYTPDGSTVRRWDRLGIRSTGDNSHLTHSHVSFFRDSEGRRARPDNILGLLVEFFEGTPAPQQQEDHDMGRQMLIRADGKLWLADGMFRRPVADAWYGNGTGPISDGQIHQAGLLGNLGVPFSTGGDLDVWGVDLEAHIAARVADAVAGIKPTLSDTQVATLAAQVSAALAAAPDVPLGDADKPAIEAALREVLRSGVGAA